MRNYEVNAFKYGLVTKLEDNSIPAGAASASLNWITKGDKIELSRGYLLLGTEQTGTGRVTGLYTAVRADGTEVLYRSRGKKVEYYDTATSDWVEVGTDILGTSADGEDVTFADYNSLAGSQLWFCSPNSSLYKIMTANRGNAYTQYDASKNYKGKIKIKQNRMALWNRTTDKTGLYLSYIDNAQYTTVSSEVLGAAGSTTYTGTLAFKSGGSKRTCFGVSVTGTTGAGAETFTDDYNGVLTGSLGGTGTINYSTGAISVTFNGVVTSGNVTVSYQWEDATNQGIADFTKSTPRTAGQGQTFRQDDGGGDFQSVFSYGDTEYCMHERKTWALTLGRDDTTATNLIYRTRVGIPNFRAAIDTGNGIYYVDDIDQNEPVIRLMTLDVNLNQVVPVTISQNLDLSDYRFDTAAVIEWGDYVLFACRTSDSTINNRVIMYNKLWKAFDIRDYFISCFTIYNGTLVVGDSISNNVYELFSGLDDDDSTIPNYWEGGLTTFGINQMKKTRRLVLEGEIGAEQSIKIYLAYDNGSYVEAATISGDGDYVDKSQSVTVGASTLGRPELGGGSTTSITAYHFMREIKLDTTKFYDVKIKFEAQSIGWAAISLYRFQDIILKNTKIAEKYRN